MKLLHQPTGYTKLTHLCYTAVDAIITHMGRLPGGYAFWYSLPKIGKHSQSVARRRIAQTLMQHCFPQTFITMLVHTALTQEGMVDSRGSKLYHWLLEYAYQNNVKKLYEHWLHTKVMSDTSEKVAEHGSNGSTTL